MGVIAVEPNGDSQGCQRKHLSKETVPQNPAQRACVAILQPLGKARTLPFILRTGPQKLAAKRGRERERNDRRNKNRGAQGYRKFAEKASDQSSHQKNWNKDRHEREAYRNDRKSDLLRTLQGGLERGLSLLDMSHDVFNHDDGIIHQKANRDGERHQRDIVEAESTQPHDGESPRQRERHGHPGNEGRPESPKEDRHDDDDQGDGQDERELDIVHRCSNGLACDR